MSSRRIFDGRGFGLFTDEEEESERVREREETQAYRTQNSNIVPDPEPNAPSPRPSQRLYDRLQRARLPVRSLPADSGIFQTDGLSPRISLRPAPGQKVISKKNAFIVFGKDRPSTLASGYGGKGALNCDTIDVVVGRMSSANNVNTRRTATIVNPNFGADAARIYISQLTDIDTNFGIVDGITGNTKSRSGIGIKADAVRLIGREGVKIVTGKAPFDGFGPDGETNSLGGKIKQISPKIELLAGNTEGTRDTFSPDYIKFMKSKFSINIQQESTNIIQPVCRTENLMDSMTDLRGILEKTINMIYNMALIQSAANASLGLDLFPANIAHKAAAGSMSAIQLNTMVLQAAHQLRINTNLWASNYFEPYGYKYIASRSVFAT